MGKKIDVPLLGRLAVHQKLITMDQLAEATREQGNSGGTVRLGDIFVDKGWISPAQLRKLVSIQRQVRARIAAENAARAANPDPPAATRPPAPAPHPARVVKKAPAPRPTRPEESLKEKMPTPRPAPVEGGRVEEARVVEEAPAGRPASTTSIAPEIASLLQEAAASQASDLHLHSGAPVKMRRHGVFRDHDETHLEPERAETMIRSILSEEQARQFDAAGELDFAYDLPGAGRFRVNVYKQQHGVDGVFRVVPPEPPSLESLGLPSSLAKLTNYHHGMVLLTGPAGCGKSATMAAFLDLINVEQRSHIITVEDPIETLHPSKRCLVNQRQVGPHTESFARALRAALREDPDVIAIGELRDLETISLALTAAETGHFVLATLHTNNSIRTISRLVGAFPPDQQSQVRTMLSESLRGIVSQRLVLVKDGSHRVPALEVLLINKAVGNLIRENKTFQIPSILQTGVEQGMCLLDESLAELVRSGTVAREEALRFCEDPKRIPD